MKTRLICLLVCAVMAQEVVGYDVRVKITTQEGLSTNVYINGLENAEKHLPDIVEGYKSITFSGKVRWGTKMSLDADEKHALELSSLEEVTIDGYDTTQYMIVSRIDRVDIRGDNIKKIVLPQSMIRLDTVSIDSPSFEGFDISRWSIVGKVSITGATNNITMTSKMSNLHTIEFKDCDIETLRIESDRLGIWDARWGEHLFMTIRNSYIGELDVPDRIYDKISIDVFGPGGMRLNPGQYFGVANPILIKVVGEYTAIKWRKGIEIETKFEIDGGWRDMPIDRCFMMLWRDQEYNQFFRIKPEENNPILIQADIIPEKQVE